MSMSSQKIFKGAALLSFGQIASYGLSFIRNIIFARVLTKADFGLAAALSMSISLLELVNRMGLGRQIVQAVDGDKPQFQASAHAFQLTIGFISALLILIAAHPIALAFRVPEQTWAFAMLATVPLIRGAIHLDVMRVQRQFNYGPSVWSELIPQILSTLAAWPLAVWLGDFRAVLFIMLGRELLVVALSHFFAERPFQLAWIKKYGRKMIAFGWPLLLNGFVMFAAQQGDQMLIGAAFTLADLGAYSIAFTLSSIPFMIFGQVASSLMLPALANYQTNHVRFQDYYQRCLELSVLGSLAIVGPLMLAGDPIVRLLYGQKYAGAGTLVTVFGVVVALRFFRMAPAMASMSRADTINQLIGNIGRAISLPLALLMVSFIMHKIVAVAACGIVGELVAILVTVLRLRKSQGIALQVHIKPILFLVGWITLGVVLYNYLGHGISLWLTAGAVLLLWVIGAVASLLLFPNLTSMYRNIFLDFRIKVLFALI